MTMLNTRRKQNKQSIREKAKEEELKEKCSLETVISTIIKDDAASKQISNI